jgi:hypothetical protein
MDKVISRKASNKHFIVGWVVARFGWLAIRPTKQRPCTFVDVKRIAKYEQLGLTSASVHGRLALA